METPSDFEKYQKAKQQVEEIKGFYSHLTSYVVVIAVLVYINLRFSPEYLWFLWTAAGWGLGLLSHANKVFGWLPYLGKDWEQRKLKQFMDEEQSKENLSNKKP